MKRYSLNNILVLLKDWKNIDSIGLFLSIFKILLIIVKPVLVALIPKIILDCIENDFTINTLLLRIFILSIFIVITNWLDPIISERINVTVYKSQNYYKIKIMNILLFMDYKDLESSTVSNYLHHIDIFLSYGRFNSLESFYSTLIQFLASTFGIISYIILFSKIHLNLIIFIFLSVIIDLFLLKWLKSKNLLMKNNTDDIWSYFNYLSDKSIDISVGKELRLYNFANWFINLSKDLLNNFITSIYTYSKQSFIANILRISIALIRDLLILYALINNVSNGFNSISDFVFYFGLLTGFSTWILGISQYSNNLKLISKQSDSLLKFLNTYKENDTGNTSSSNTINQLDLSQITIEFNNVSFKYPGNNSYTLKNISFKINNGEKLAIVGENGPGKSTCIKLLCGFYEPTEGEILFNGKNLKDINKNNEYFNLLSVVFQDFGILPLSIKDNITFGFEENNNLLKALEQSGLDKIINKLKYKEDTYLIKEINAEAVNLSGGEIQRLLLARALYKNFKILILDEPTAALDAIAEDELYKKYSEFSKEKISIFISHRLSSTKFCDRILYLSNGKIESIGTHEELLKHSIKYKQMYYAQSKYYK